MIVKNHNTVLRVIIGAAALGIASISMTSYAQNSDVPPAGAQGADSGVAARVKQALHSDKTLDDRHMQVAVEHGDVVLNGFVESSREISVATQVATKAAGDHKVVNRLSVMQNNANAP